MRAEHHRSIVEVARLVVEQKQFSWASGIAAPVWEKLAEWVPATDTLDDVVIEEQFTANIVAAVGHPTCFQHFSYAGLVPGAPELRDGNTVVGKRGGYNWDCDPYLPWYAEMANASCAKVRYNSDAGFLPRQVLEKSPGALRIQGDQDWDNQSFPSATELIVFYSRLAEELKKSQAGFALRAKACALHLYADLCVPHHLSNTIGHDHATWEDQAWAFWQRVIVQRSASAKKAAVISIADDVSRLMRQPRYVAVHDWTIAQTRKLVAMHAGMRMSKIVSYQASCTAIAATLLALKYWEEP